MKDKRFIRYCLLACIGVLSASYYPLSMGIRVIADMLKNGVVLKEDYPKYIIPYTPIAVAVILGTVLMPLCIRYLKKRAFLGGVMLSVAAFFAVEWLFERRVVVAAVDRLAELLDWQMYTCFANPNEFGFKTRTALQILTGDYNAAFKLHFYVISIVLIVTVLNVLYGFGQIVKTGDRRRLRSLVLQAVCTFVLLGLCILACFTAFWRTGSIRITFLPTIVLMTLFFILFGMTMGCFTGSFLLGKPKAISVLIPSITASLMTLLMYIGEMILLSNSVYRFGTGFFFEGLPVISLAPFDLLTVLASGAITAILLLKLNKKQYA